MKYSSFSNLYTNKKQNINNIYNTSKNYLMTYSRIAFYEILKHNLCSNNTVYLPNFICKDILSSIKELKLKYIYYEVDKNLNPILDFDVNCDLLLIVNYFGFPQNKDLFKYFINSKKCITVEDNSHGFLSRDKYNNLLGTRYDCGFISLYKSVLIGNGSICIINNNKIKINNLVEKNTNNIYFSLKMFCIRYLILNDKIGLYIFLFKRMLRKILFQSKYTISSLNDENELPKNIFINKNYSLNNFSLDLDLQIKKRRKLYMFIMEIIKDEFVEPIFNELEPHTVPFCFPFYTDKKNILKIELILKKYNLFVIPWPSLPSDIKKIPSFYNKVFYIPFKI